MNNTKKYNFWIIIPHFLINNLILTDFHQRSFTQIIRSWLHDTQPLKLVLTPTRTVRKRAYLCYQPTRDWWFWMNTLNWVAHAFCRFIAWLCTFLFHFRFFYSDVLKSNSYYLHFLPYQYRNRNWIVIGCVCYWISTKYKFVANTHRTRGEVRNTTTTHENNENN